MKTAISIPDAIFQKAEEAAQRMGISRSELLPRAVRALLESQQSSRITDSFNEAFGDQPADERLRRFSRAAARKDLAKVEW